MITLNKLLPAPGVKGHWCCVLSEEPTVKNAGVTQSSVPRGADITDGNMTGGADERRARPLLITLPTG